MLSIALRSARLSSAGLPLIVKAQPLQALKDDAHAGQKALGVKDGVELARRECAALIGLESLAKALPRLAPLHLCPRGHGALLHDLVGILAREARVHKGQQHLGREDEPPRPVEVGAHLLWVEHQAVYDADKTLEHVVEGDEGIRLGDALGRGVTDVTLMPEGDVVEGYLRVGLDDAREATDLLHRDGVALVGHGRRTLLPLLERFLGLEGVGLLEAADLSRDALAGGRDGREHARQEGMVVAGDDLRGERVDGKTQPLTDVSLDARVDARVAAHRARDRAAGDALPGVDKTVEVTPQFPGPGAKLHAKGHGLGVDAMRAPHAERVFLLKGATPTDPAKCPAILDEDICGLRELVAQGSVAKVRARHAVVDPSTGLGAILRDIRVHVGAHVGEKGDDVVVGYGLYLVYLVLVKGGVLANPGGLLARDADLAQLGMGLAGKDLDFLPDGVLVLEREDVAHLGARVAIDHGIPFMRGAAGQRARAWPYTSGFHHSEPTPRERQRYQTIGVRS